MRPAASAARLRTRLLGQPMPGGRGPEVFQQVFGSPLGASDARVIARHILPNALSPLIVQASFNMGEAILIAAGLSFIGFGAQPPTPEWGVMISEGRDYITTQWWVPTFPGLAILLAVTGFNLVGDGLRDLLDPRLRRAG